MRWIQCILMIFCVFTGVVAPLFAQPNIELGDKDLAEYFPRVENIDSIELNTQDFVFSFRLPQLTWRHINHFYTFHIEGEFKTVRGNFTFSIDSVDQDGNTIDSQLIVTSSQLMGKSSWSGWPMAITKAQLDNRGNNAVTARLVLRFDQWKGKFHLHSLKARKFILTEEQARKHFFCPSKPQVTACQSWDIGYTPAESTPDTISDTLLKLIRTAGVRKMRIQGMWGEMKSKLIQGGSMPEGQNPLFESSRGEYHFEYVDKLINEASYYGIGIAYMTIHGTPQWAHTKTREDLPAHQKSIVNPFFPPDDWEDYERFVRALVTHFKGRVPAYEVWTEFDVPHYGLIGGKETYMNYLRCFYENAKFIDPNVSIIMGRANSYLSPLLRDGAAKFCDEISLHPYPGRGVRDIQPCLFLLRQMQTALYANKIFNHPIRVTEVGFGAGWSWAGPGGQDGELAKAERTSQLLRSFAGWTHEICLYLPSWTERRYGWMQYEHEDRLRPMPVYHAIADFIEELKAESSVIKTNVVMPDSVRHGEIVEIKLVAVNRSDQPQTVTFWPIGFVPATGHDTLEVIREFDWEGVLEPGQRHSVKITIRPSRQAFGNYPVGLAVLTENGNSLSLQDLKIWDITRDAIAVVSGDPKGNIQCLHDLTLPVWGGDFDTAIVEWPVQELPRNESVEYTFPEPVIADEFTIYWVENSEPQPPLQAKFHGEREGLRHHYGKYKKPKDIEIEYFDPKKQKWFMLPFELTIPEDAGRNHITIFKSEEILFRSIRFSFRIPHKQNVGIYDILIGSKKEY